MFIWAVLSPNQTFLCLWLSVSGYSLGIVYKKTITHSSLLFKGYKNSGEGIWYSSSDNFATQLLNNTQKDIFDFLRENERFQTIIKQLQKYSGTWSV